MEWMNGMDAMDGSDERMEGWMDGRDGWIQDWLHGIVAWMDGMGGWGCEQGERMG